MGRRVEIGVLGPVDVRLDGAAVRVPSQPQRVVLARLALAYPRVVPVPDLMSALWVGEPPPNAIGNLHGYVSKLRQLVGRDSIVREPGGYRLAIEADQLDLTRARALVAAADDGTEPRAVRQALDAAVALWRGDPLSDLDDVMPFAPELAALSEWRRQVRERWFAATLDAGDTGVGAVVPEIERAVAADPLRESLVLLWMRALHLSGRTADAVAAAATFRKRLAEETGLDPSPAFEQMQRDILTGAPRLRPAKPAPVAPKVRPAPRDRFIGREQELALVRNSLAQHRVVTIVGPGGVGKTRLLQEYLRAHPEPLVVELASVSSRAAVGTYMAASLGIRTLPEGAAAAIADRLGPDPVMLAVDNCEHVLDGARELIDDLLVRCPALRVVATSRQRLGLPDEVVVRLGPLAEDEQVELFCDRAARLRSDFDTTPPARQLAGDICRLVDGLPLAVELAARREAAFGLRQLRDRLASGLDVLEPTRDGTRSTAVTATVEWSYRLLDEEARRLFDRLAVCVGGFGLDAVDGLAPPGIANAPALLADLVDASLVLSDLSADPPRYRLLEVMRHVGLGHLTVSELDGARRAHAAWMVSHVDLLYQLRRDRAEDTTTRLRREAANLEAALGWLVDTGQWDLAVRLAAPLTIVLSDEPSLGLVAQLARFAPDTPVTTGAAGTDPMPAAAEPVASLRLLVGGAAGWMAGDAARAAPLLDRALAGLAPDDPYRWIARFFRLTNAMFTGDVAAVEADAIELADDPGAHPWAVATGLCCACLINLFAGDRRAAQRWLDRQPAVLSEVGATEGFIAYTYGEVLAQTDPDSALEWFERAYAVSDAHGHTYNREVALIGRVALLIRQGRHALAARLCAESIRSLRRVVMVPAMWTALRLGAELLVAVDDPEPAAALLAAAEADPVAPPVRGPDRDREREQWRYIRRAMTVEAVDAARRRAIAGGRAGAIETALAALARH